MQILPNRLVPDFGAQILVNALGHSCARSLAILRFSRLEKQLLRQHWHALATRLRCLSRSGLLFILNHVSGGFLVMDID